MADKVTDHVQTTGSESGDQEDKSSIQILRLDEELQFADGGAKAYSVVAGCCMGLVSVFGMLNSVGAIQTYISTHQLISVKPSTISWIFALYIFAIYASSIFCGCYFDRNGCKAAKYVGYVLSVVGAFCLAECEQVYQFIICLSLLYGVGSGVLMTCYVSSVATWFKEKRAHAQSIASIGGSLGGIIFPVMLRKLYSQVGYKWAIRILAFILTACLTPSVVLAQENAAVMKYQTKKLRWGETARIYCKYSVDLRFLKDWKFLFCALGCCFAENGLMVTATYFPTYAIATGVSETTSYTLITVMNTAGILGRASGYIADRFTGRIMILMICLSIMTLLSLVMWLPFGHSLKVLYAFSALYGVVCSSILSLVPVAIGQVCKIEEFGRKYSMMYFMTALTSLAVLPIAGVIIGTGTTKSYNNFIIYCSMLTLAGSACYGITRYCAIGVRKIKF
ncbi:LANO_0E07888g1_1 [Lachancea nothofagi CBS 11611]|uniref:LANO_0E07888g1_1 n=1 Tax=Lachancea nothofagi CBS 11611 TaxID=1266666 RepID=A0A1G4JV16_9SACH|nr:LANO_0E07888g1_1 [Lachancea nothofagi CBS 11611]